MIPLNLPAFCPARWLPNGHYQTLYAALLMPTPQLAYRREIIHLPDGDEIAADWVAGQPDKPLLIMVHGMEGDSESRYARLVMNHCLHLGWRGVVLHMRSCGGHLNLKPTFYHAGHFKDIQYFCDQVLGEREGDQPIYLVGVSLGGSQIAHYLSKAGSDRNIRGAVMISTPLDLKASADFMSGGLNRLYVLKFRSSLVKKYRAKGDLMQDPAMVRDLARAKTFWDLDNAATAPLHGFVDAASYYAQMSAKKVLKDLLVPTLYLAARDDPFVPEYSLPRQGEHHENFQSVLTDHGGHVGFVGQGGRSWMVDAIFAYFQTLGS